MHCRPWRQAPVKRTHGAFLSRYTSFLSPMSDEKVQREYSKDVQDDTESSDVYRSGEVGGGLHRQLKNRHVAMIRFVSRALPNPF